MIQSLLHLGHLPPGRLPGRLPGRWTADTQPGASGVVATISSRVYTACGHILMDCDVGYDRELKKKSLSCIRSIDFDNHFVMLFIRR